MAAPEPAGAATTGKRDWSAIGASILVGAAVAAAAGDGAVRLAGIPVPAACIALAFAMQWIGFPFAWLRRTERFYDLTGSMAFLAVTATALAASGEPDARALAIAALVGIWAVRLGLFLTRRIHGDGFDRRFTDIQTRFSAFLMAWTLQGLWVSMSVAAGLAAIAAADPVPADGLLAAGMLLWAAGFAFEVTADAQKRRFRADPANAGRFIHAGLWAWCRHPNYFGEVLLWTGIAVAAWPALSGWAHLTLLSPVFVWLLLTRISGMPLLEASAERRWGGDPRYRAYRSRTPALVPLPPGLRRGRRRTAPR